MAASSAITIRSTEEEIRARLAEADSPLPDAEITFRPAPGDRGTEVRARIDKITFGQKIAAVVGTDTQQRLDDALRRLKQVVETGEVLRSDGSPGGTDAKQQRTQEAAQPSAPNA
jgi:uncharacterized membrane protein